MDEFGFTANTYGDEQPILFIVIAAHALYRESTLAFMGPPELQGGHQ